MSWKSTKESLPPHGLEVLILFDGDVVQAYHDGVYWIGSRFVRGAMNNCHAYDPRICEVTDTNSVTGWMKLPKKPIDI